MLELKDKLGADAATGSAGSTRGTEHVGYHERTARARIQRHAKRWRPSSSCPDGVAVADGIKQALKLLAKGLKSRWRSKPTR